MSLVSPPTAWVPPYTLAAKPSVLRVMTFTTPAMASEP